ncbi:MAG: hypothetical protein Q9164_001395 [Protoblastenia rupestris]
MFHLSSQDGESSAKSWTNRRKRALQEDSSNTTEPHCASVVMQSHTSEARPSPKRHKTAEWPLRDDVGHEGTGTIASKGRTKSPLSHRKRHNKKPPRPSKFVEGSLNDKPSTQPPPAYIGQEEAMEDYAENLGRGSSGGEVVCDTGVISNKQSGIFRFGKAIANALNPTTMWQGINGIWKEREQSVNAVKPMTLDRQDELFKVYEDMKRDGFKGIKTTIAPAVGKGKRLTLEQKEDVRCTSFRDSAIDVEETASSSRPSQDNSARNSLKPPPASHNPRSVSPLSNANSSRRSFTHLRSPSFQDLKKVKSHIQLPSSRLWSSGAPHLSNTALVDSTGAPPTDAGLRRQPSKKDIARVYKLNKRVSDLESKLETARQDLEQSLRDAPPMPNLPVYVGRKPFVPGNLPSLPSSSFIEHYVNSVEEQSAISDQTRLASNTLIESHTNRPQPIPDATQSHTRPHIDPMEIFTEMKRRLEKSTAPNSKASRQQSAKAQDLNPASSTKRPLSKAPQRTPCNSPSNGNNDVSPVPTAATIFDPSTVDQARLLAMRFSHDTHVPLGKSADDLINLRKLYPSATESQLTAYLASQEPINKKATDYTSVQHTNRPASPFLPRPCPVSPLRTRSGSRQQKRGISPPPPSLASAQKEKKKKCKISDVDDDESALTATGNSDPILGDKSEDGAARTLLETDSTAGNAGKIGVDKPLPDSQNEDFEWDEDVF